MTLAAPAAAAIGRRSAALALLVLLAAGVYATLVSPVVDRYLADRSTAAQLRLAVDGYRRIASRLPALKAQLAALQAGHPSHSGYLPGANETIAAAELQHRVKAIVLASGGDLRTVEMLPAQPQGRLRKIGLRGQMTIGLAGLQKVLYLLNETRPFLFFDGLDIRVREDDVRRGRPGEDAQLNVAFDVYGYLWSEK